MLSLYIMITLHGVQIRLVRVTQTTISFELKLREGVHLEIILFTKERGGGCLRTISILFIFLK